MGRGGEGALSHGNENEHDEHDDDHEHDRPESHEDDTKDDKIGAEESFPIHDDETVDSHPRGRWHHQQQERQHASKGLKKYCFAFCKQAACEELNGDTHLDCGACDPTKARCNPLAPDFPSHLEKDEV